MNYQHAFHAGNFADVHKHIVLTRVLDYLRQKPAAFRVIDTHAGAGRYDLLGSQAADRVNGGTESSACSRRRGSAQQEAIRRKRWSRLISTSSEHSIQAVRCVSIPDRR